MIKWEHSVFALPFALSGALLAANGLPSVHQLVWIVVAMISARSAAMAFNRVADAAIDAANPRTQTRALPAGTLTPLFVTTFVVVSCAVFALAIAPAAAWIAVRASFDPRILLLTAAVTFWVGGFDVLYACQDFDFDREANLHSVPRFVGIRGALMIARLFHLLMLVLLVALLASFGLGKLAAIGVIAVALLLTYEHSLVSPDDLSKLNAAFFTMNGVISVVFFVFVAADLLVQRR